MTRRLTPRHRRTRLGFGIGRAAGFYEQCDHRTSAESTFEPRDVHGGSIDVFGLVGRPGRLSHHVLRSIAGSDRLSDFDARTVAICDVLSEVRLVADADLIMWHGADGSRIATPVARLFDDVEAALLIGGVDQTVAPQWSAPVVLRSASLPKDGQMAIVSFAAMTFAQFVGGER